MVLRLLLTCATWVALWFDQHGKHSALTSCQGHGSLVIIGHWLRQRRFRTPAAGKAWPAHGAPPP